MSHLSPKDFPFANCDKDQLMMLGVIPGSGTDAEFYLIKLVSDPEAES